MTALGISERNFELVQIYIFYLLEMKYSTINKSDKNDKNDKKDNNNKKSNNETENKNCHMIDSII